MKIVTERLDGIATLIVTGEVDAAEKAQVGAAVRAALAQGTRGSSSTSTA